MNTNITILARLAGTLLFLFLAVFVIAESPPNPFRLTTQENLYALGLAALYGGLALAWYRATWGGVLSLSGWVFLAVLSRHLPLDLPLLLPAAVGLIHLICGLTLRGAPPAPRPRWLTFVIYGVFPVFVLLSANEMLGNPPLMAMPERPIAQLAGAWSDEHANLILAADASVTGTIGPIPILSAHLAPNRSWFGRLLRWRTDYRIRGTLADGQTLNVLLNANANQLTGTLQRSGARGHSRLRLLNRTAVTIACRFPPHSLRLLSYK